MRYVKTILLACLILFVCGCLVGPYLIGQWALKKIPQHLNMTKQYGISLFYQDMKAPFCFLCVKVVANNAKATVFNQSIDLGKVEIKMPIWDWHLFQFEAQANEQLDYYLSLSGALKNGEINVLDAHFMWDKLKATLSGRMNLNHKEIALKGQASNLLDFINPYVPKAVSMLLPLVIKNTSQEIEIDTYNQYLRVNKIPLLNLEKTL